MPDLRLSAWNVCQIKRAWFVFKCLACVCVCVCVCVCACVCACVCVCVCVSTRVPALCSSVWSVCQIKRA